MPVGPWPEGVLFRTALKTFLRRTGSAGPIHRFVPCPLRNRGQAGCALPMTILPGRLRIWLRVLDFGWFGRNLSNRSEGRLAWGRSGPEGAFVNPLGCNQ